MDNKKYSSFSLKNLRRIEPHLFARGSNSGFNKEVINADCSETDPSKLGASTSNTPDPKKPLLNFVVTNNCLPGDIFLGSEDIFLRFNGSSESFFFCVTCPKILVNPGMAFVHALKEHGFFSCPSCDHIAYSPQLAVQHCVDADFRCFYCRDELTPDEYLSFPNRKWRQWTHHMAAHRGRNFFEVNGDTLCDCFIARYGQCRPHRRDSHASFGCAACEFETTSVERQKEHIERVHMRRDGLLSCPKCAFLFTEPPAWIEHIRGHWQEEAKLPIVKCRELERERRRRMDEEIFEAKKRAAIMPPPMIPAAKLPRKKVESNPEQDQLEKLLLQKLVNEESDEDDDDFFVVID